MKIFVPRGYKTTLFRIRIRISHLGISPKKFIRVSFIFACAVSLLLQINVSAENENYNEACKQECGFMTKDCQAYTECRVAYSTCLENCMQRHVWEKVATALDKLSIVLEQQGKEEAKQNEVINELQKAYSSTPLVNAPVTNQTSVNQTVPSQPEKAENSSDSFRMSY
jgi:hypothetical protein